MSNDKIKHKIYMNLASQRRKCKYLYFVRDDAPEKDAAAEANDAREVDAQGYVLYWLIKFKHAKFVCPV